MPVYSIRFNSLPVIIKHELMLNDIIPFELSISMMITQSPSLVSMSDTLVYITTLANAFLNLIESQCIVANKTIKWSTNSLEAVD